MNKILAFFGLAKINRVKRLSALLHKWYVAAVIDGVERDFGVGQAHNFNFEDEMKWWNDELDSLMSHNTDDVVLVNSKPKFSCYSNQNLHRATNQGQNGQR